MVRKRELMEEVQRSIDVLSDALGAARKVHSALGALRDNWSEGIRRLTDLDNDVLYIRGLTLDEVQREALRRALRSIRVHERVSEPVNRPGFSGLGR